MTPAILHRTSCRRWRFHTSIVLQWETGRRGINQNNSITNTAFTPFWCNFYYIDYL